MAGRSFPWICWGEVTAAAAFLFFMGGAINTAKMPKIPNRKPMKNHLYGLRPLRWAR